MLVTQLLSTEDITSFLPDVKIGLLLTFLDLSCTFHAHPSVLTLSTATASLLVTCKVSTWSLTFPASGQLISFCTVFLPFCGARGACLRDWKHTVSPGLCCCVTLQSPADSREGPSEGCQDFLASDQPWARPREHLARPRGSDEAPALPS